jgi:RND family efflux transporter MFP subunit
MRNQKVYVVLLPLFLIAACKKEAPQMPPATGAEAPPLPKLPKIATGSQSGSVSGTEGRTTGTTFPKQEAQIGAVVGGVLQELVVQEGDRVKKGDVLFRQDARDAVLRSLQAKAALAAAEASLAGLETDYKRGEALIKDKAMGRAQWEQLQAAYASAKAGIESARVQVQMADKMVSDAVVRAPFSGVVTQKLKNEGEMLAMMPPSPVLILQDQSSLDLRFRLPEAALTKVKAGDQIIARFVAIGQEKEATIVRIMPTVDSRTRTVEIVASIPNSDLSLRPGLLAEVGFHENAVQAQGGQP